MAVGSVVAAMAYVASHLAGAAFVVGLLFLTGRAIAGRWLRPARETSFRVLLEITLGTVAWTGALFVLAATHVLRPLTVWLLTGVVLVLGIPTVGALFRDASSSVKRFFISLRGLGWPGPVLMAAVLLMTLSVASVALLPDLDWDDAVYHLSLPKLWLKHEGFVRIPFSVYSSWPLNFELLYSLGMLFNDHVVSKLIHFAFGLLLLGAIGSYGRSRGSSVAGLCAVVLFLANQTVLVLFTNANVELGFAFFFFMAFVLLEKHLEGEGRIYLLLAAVCCGYLMGAKFTGVFVAVSLLSLLIVSVMTKKGSLEVLAVDGFLFTTVSLGLAAPWYLKSFVTTGNPIYPLGYTLFGGPEWSAALSEQLHAWYRSMGAGRSPSDYLKLPYRIIFQSGEGYDHFGGHLSRFWAVFLPVSLIPLVASTWARRLLLVSSVYFVLWALSSQQVRFLVPILPFLSINAAFGLAVVGEKLHGADLRKLAAAITVALPLLALAVNGYGYLGSWWERVSWFYSQEKGAIVAESRDPMFDFINSQTPASAKLMFLNTNFGFWCDREYLADSAFEASQMNELIRSAGSESGLENLLARQGITHILFANVDWKISYPPYLFDFLDRETHVVARTADGRLTLHEIRR